jgi:urea transport system permease protein
MPTAAISLRPSFRISSQLGLPALLVCVALVLPLFNAVFPPGHPLHLSLFVVNLAGQIMCFALLALALDFVWGLLGVLSLGHGIFFGIGGYVMGFHLLNSAYADTQVLPDFMQFMGWSTFPAALQPFAELPVAVLLGLMMAVLVGGVVGLAAFRSRINGVYFSIITQALTYALMLLLFNNDLGLGGNNGLTGFTLLAGFDLAHESTQVGLASLSAVVLAAVFFLLRWLALSSFGQAMVAVRDDEARLRFLGFRTDRIKLAAWCLSAAVAALAGMLYVPQVGIINPGIVSPMLSVEIAVWVAIGGRGTLIGAVLGAVILNCLKFWLSAEIPSAWPFVLAGITLLITVALQNGLWGGLQQLRALRATA